MRRFIPVVLTALLLAVIVPSYARLEEVNTSVEEKKVMSYDIAKEILIENNRTLKEKQLEERKVFNSYNETVQVSRGINTEGINIEMFGMEHFISYPDDVQMMLTMQKKLMPFTERFGWQMSLKEKELTEKVLDLTLRDLYLGLLSTSRNYDISVKKLELEEKKYNANNIRLENGLISKIDFKESQHQYLKAKKDCDRALRDLENMKRNFNSVLGVSVDTEYDELLFEELKRDVRIQPLENYIENALENRLEILALEGQIEMTELQISIYEKNRVNETYVRVQKDYSQALRELESLKIQLEQAKIDIENEIKSAYIDVKKEGYNLQSLNDTLNMQTRNYQRMESQYEQGFIAKLVIDEVQLGLEELRNGLDLAMYNYNTKIMKLEEAAGLGPSY
ncbi:TolC family protein [Herbivorax sp. ANBcel31]|uniref:TolC family protein n=1 Tax=Herbivorax sp. ANBcel31 TaxID=3069754 RepID=UPI0027AF63A6|nr:TolC family protein [Herbivorax sp. ANBcel31]MDQ2086935.1 TolC family protein [Herbivorax sp. ANBcel31]